MDTFYVQCELVRNNIYQVAWLPERFATSGKVLKICGVDGWIVKDTYQRLLDKYILEHEMDYRRAFASIR